MDSLVSILYDHHRDDLNSHKKEKVVEKESRKINTNEKEILGAIKKENKAEGEGEKVK